MTDLEPDPEGSYTPAAPATPRPEHQRSSFIPHHPLLAFGLGAFGLGWPLLALSTATGWGHTPLGLAFTFGALLGSALGVSRLADGPGAGRRLLARFLLWRLGRARWTMVVVALPALTLLVAAGSGTLHTPSAGWLAAGDSYLFQTFITGALMANLAEEGAWSGFVQTRLTARHGLFRGALLTAPLFAAIHLPLQFGPGWSWSSVGVGVTALLVIAPFFRYVLGETLTATGGSLLAVGVLHASFNASSGLDLPGGWQSLPAIMLLAILLALFRRIRARADRQLPGNPSLAEPVVLSFRLLPSAVPRDRDRCRRPAGHVSASAAGDSLVGFIGIAPTADVNRYLASAVFDEVTDLNLRPFALTVARHAGPAIALPCRQRFWPPRRAHGQPPTSPGNSRTATTGSSS